MNSAKLITITPDAEKLMTYVARVSNPLIRTMKTMQVFFDTVLNTIIGVCLNRVL